MPTGVYVRTEEMNKHTSKALKGKPKSAEHKKHMSEVRKGKPHPKKGGYPCSEETKEKIRKTKTGKGKGKNNPNWKGGISFEPYSKNWTETLKRSIRERDGYTCRLCGHYPAFDIHHKDYDKLNCNPDNLITLCHSCHSKTNGDREYWIKYFLGEKNGKV